MKIGHSDRLQSHTLSTLDVRVRIKGFWNTILMNLATARIDSPDVFHDDAVMISEDESDADDHHSLYELPPHSPSSLASVSSMVVGVLGGRQGESSSRSSIEPVPTTIPSSRTLPIHQTSCKEGVPMRAAETPPGEAYSKMIHAFVTRIHADFS